MLGGVKPLRIALLGTPVVEVDGRPLVVDTRKAVAMLAYLAVTGHPQSRAVLADLLWDELDSERASGALRRTLSTLRGALGEGRIRADRSQVVLELEGAWFDLAATRAVAGDPEAGLEDLRAACELHRDDLLAGFALRDRVGFEDWLREEQDAMRRERAALLDRLTDALANAGLPDEAVARCRERLSLDHLHEPTHRRLMALYVAAGRRGDALSQYRECVRALDRELGVTPLPETSQLYDAISTGTPPTRPIVASPPATTTALPLVGRERELRTIVDAFDRIGENGAFIVVEGESGVGKTRLAQEALRCLGERGTSVHAVRAHAGEQGLPYGVLASLLRAAIGKRPEAIAAELRSDVARLLPELGEPAAARLDDSGARLRFLEALATVLAAATAGGAVLIDDLHWCDPAPLDALAYLARRLERRPLLLLGARRTDEPDPERRLATLSALGQRIALGRLMGADVAVLASKAGFDSAAGERVYAESDGLPLFVVELLSAPAADATRGIRALIDARLDAVEQMAIQVLGAAAIIGGRFDAEELRAVSGRSDEEIAAALRELTIRGLITELPGGYDFVHERVRAAVADRLGRARRHLLHRRLADSLRARRADHALVARHLELAGDDSEAATAYAAAGDRARALGAQSEAVAHYEAALGLGHPQPAALREATGDVHTLRGEYGAALAAYNSSAALTEPDASGRLEYKLGAVYERRGDWELAEIHYGRALALGAERAVVQADRSRVAWRRGDADCARALGFEALELAEADGARAAAAQANNLLGLLGCGRAYLERSLELSAGLRDSSVRIAALNNLALDHAAVGELPQAEALTREALELCVAQGDRHHEAALRTNLADLLHRAGRSDGAMEELKRAVTGFATIGSDGDALYPGVWSLVEW
jgi:DNA-binding SARP family transcriptional activator